MVLFPQSKYSNLKKESCKYHFTKSNSYRYFLKHIEDEFIVSLNDIAATSSNSFVATNDFKYANALWRVIEIFGKLCKGNVVQYDGIKSSILLPDRCYPNGINYRCVEYDSVT